MTLNYIPAVFKGHIHVLAINGELITTTKAKEVLSFGKARIKDKYVWKVFKEAVRLAQPLTIKGGQP